MRDVTRVRSGDLSPLPTELCRGIDFDVDLRLRGGATETVVVIVPTSFPTVGFATASPVTPSRTNKSIGIG